MVSRSRRYALSFLFVACSLATGCKDDGEASQTASLLVAANAAEGSVLVGPGGVLLSFPPGAATTDTNVVMTTAPRSRRASAAGVIASTPIELGPDGTKFAESLQLTIPISPGDIPAGASLDDAVVVTAPHGSNAYVPLPTRREGNAVIATTDHFSDFAVVFPPAPLDPPEVDCPIPTGSWVTPSTYTWVLSLHIRKEGVHVLRRVDAIFELPLERLSMADGTVGSDIAAIANPFMMEMIPNEARLSAAKVNGVPNLFVSYSNGLYSPDTTVVQLDGGLVRVGPLGTTLPPTTSVVAGTEGSVLGVFGGVGGPYVYRWPTLGATSGTYSRFVSDGMSDRIEGSVNVSLEIKESANPPVPLYSGAEMVALVQADATSGSDASWSLIMRGSDGTDAPIVGPAPVLVLATHDSLPIVYTVDSSGLVAAHTLGDNRTLSTREVARIPSDVAIRFSSAQPIYTNGSLLVSAVRGTTPTLIRIRLASGKISEWVETDPMANTWSAMDAADGVVCYADSLAAIVQCGCLSTEFVDVP